MSSLREDAEAVYSTAIHASMPDTSVKECLSNLNFRNGRIIVIAIGKAAWPMANAASEMMGNRITSGVLVTKYGHSKGAIDKFEIIEAGHPIPDQNSELGARKAMKAVENLSADDTVLLLLSGGGSALFELSELSLDEIQEMNHQLIACGASIQEINTIRKRLSKVKGGRFARLCEPAHVVTIMLSDIIGDQLDMIASGPTCADSSTSEDAMEIVSRYHLQVSDKALSCLKTETPKVLINNEYHVCGSVRQLCDAAFQKCQQLGYETTILTDSMTCTARDAGMLFASIAKYHANDHKKLALIAGGETIVRLTGKGLGGRNQEIALAAAPGIDGLSNVAVFSVGSDGTDGPTDAAGGYVDGETVKTLASQGIRIDHVLEENDSYHALQKCGGLIFTGATGTNVNDVSVILIQ